MNRETYDLALNHLLNTPTGYLISRSDKQLLIELCLLRKPKCRLRDVHIHYEMKSLERSCYNYIKDNHHYEVVGFGINPFGQFNSSKETIASV